MSDELVWGRKLTKAVFDILRKVLDDQKLTPQQCLSALAIELSPIEQERFRTCATWPLDPPVKNCLANYTKGP